MVSLDISTPGYKFLSNAIKHLASIHFPSQRCNVCVLSTPRSGSTWLMEVILTQPGFKSCREPFDLRNPAIFDRLSIDKWEDLYQDETLPQLQRGQVREVLDNLVWCASGWGSAARPFRASYS